MVPEGSKKCGSARKLDFQQKEMRLKMDGCKLRQCSAILNKLMTHPTGWVFNQPVDPVKLNIPDYFSIITRPMDLGTIKTKLETRSYSDTEEFAADVRLTFSNAMRYNPPHNDVHLMAKELFNIFCLKWKSLEAKWREDNLSTSEPPISKKKQKLPAISKGVCHKTPSSLNSSAKRLTVSLDKQKLRKDLAQLSTGTMPPHLITFLRKFGSCGQDRDKIEVDIDSFDEKTVQELQRIIKGCLDSRSAQLRSLPTGKKMSHGNDSKQHFSKGRGSCKNFTGGSAIGDLHTSHSAHASSQSCFPNGPINESTTDTGPDKLLSSKNHTSSESGLDSDGLSCKENESSMPGSTDLDFSGGDIPGVEQLSPNKALRAAMMKSRFASTIVKAQQKTLLNHSVKEDPIKLQQLKEQLEKQQREEKAKIEAQLKAAEASARMRAEAELKMQRERERVAARIALQKMEKTVDIDENREILKEIEKLANAQLNINIPRTDASLSSMNGGIMSPLERLGLFIKNDDLEDEDVD